MCMLGMGRYVHVYVGYGEECNVYVEYGEVCTCVRSVGEVCTCGQFLYSWLSSFMHVTFYTTVGQLVISYI